MTVFNPNFVRNFNKPLDCPAVTIGTSTTTYATLRGFQRKCFYANGRFWVFYSDGTNIVYYTSTDGINWTVGGSSPIRADNVGYRFSVWFDGTYMHYAYTDTTNLYYRRGTPNADGSITWSAPEQTVSTSPADSPWDPMISVDSDGYAWISYSAYTTDRFPFVIKSGNNDGTWGTTPSGFPYQLSTTGNSSWDQSITPLTTGRMLALYTFEGGVVRARAWDGSSWGTEVTTTSSCAYGPTHCATAEDDDVHLIFLEATTYDITYVKYFYSTNSFGAEVTVQASTTSTSSPVISRDPATNDLYVFWAGSPTANHIYYKKCVAGTWDASPTDWIDESTDVLTHNTRLTCFYQAYGGYIGLEYMTLTASPYNVRFDFLTVAAPPPPPKGTIAVHAKLAGII